MYYDIHDVLLSVQGGAPAPNSTTDDIIARAKRRRARRAAGATAVGVAACLGIVMAALSIPGDGNRVTAAAGRPVASAPTGPVSTEPPRPVEQVDFASTLGSYRVGPYQVGPVGQVTAGYQQIPVYRDGMTWEDDDDHAHYPYAGATITVYRPGVYDPGSFTFGEEATLKVGSQYPVKIGNRPGVAVDLTYIQPDDRSHKFVRTALAWQYKDDSWATLVPGYEHGPLPRADAVRIAQGLVTTAPKRELKVPFRLGYLPTGWQAIGVTQTDARISTSRSLVVLHQGPLADPATMLDVSVPGTVSIGVGTGKPKDHLVEGLNCFAGRHECTIMQGDYLIDVVSWDVPDDTIRKIAEGLRLKDLADQSTWVPVN
jgi:hypothetical protein